MLRDEFLIQLQKFLNQIGLTLRQLEGNPPDRTNMVSSIPLSPHRRSAPRTTAELRHQQSHQNQQGCRRSSRESRLQMERRNSRSTRARIEKSKRERILERGTHPFILDGTITWPIG